MNADGTVPGILRILPAVFLIATVGAACDSGGGMNGGDDNDAPTARLDASPTEAVVGDTVRLDASESSDPDGDELSFSWSVTTPDGSDVSVSGSDAETFFVADVAGDYDPEVTASDPDDRSDSESVTVTALESVPNEVTVSFENRAADGDSLIAKNLELAGSLVAENKKSGSFTTAGSRESKQLCAVEDNFFERYCEEISLMSDRDEPVQLRPDRKEVTVASTPKDSTGAVIPDAVTFVGSDSLEIAGDGSIKRPKRSGTRKLVGDWITEEADSDKLNRYRSETITVSAAENIDRQIVIDQLIPACSDEIDNEGDGAADEEEELACSDDDLNYDPQDDNEMLYGFSRVTSEYYDDSTYVSDAEGEREVEISNASNPLPKSAEAAKGKLEVYIELKASDTTGEASGIHIKNGPSQDNLFNENTSNVIPDVDTLDGWHPREAKGLTGSALEAGTWYAIYLWDDSKVEELPPGDGSVRVYAYVGKQPSRPHSLFYKYEPEEVPKEKLAALKAKFTTLENGERMKINATDVIIKNPPEDWSVLKRMNQ